jgi:sarcosine oxidase subunit gamma
MTLEPASFARRSFLYRVLADLGAEFGEIGGAAVALRYRRPVEEEVASARRLALADLSPLPRCGFKGNGTAEWLQGQGLVIGPDSNRAYRQPGGALAARLAPTEIFLIDDLGGEGRLSARLDAAWSWGTEKPRRPCGYPMPRADSHAWFVAVGSESPTMFSKICGVDLRPHRFADLAVVQTSVAKMSAILIREDRGGVPGFHLLADSASAEYLWNCVMDAMEEFGGAAVGLEALRRLGPP